MRSKGSAIDLLKLDAKSIPNIPIIRPKSKGRRPNIVLPKRQKKASKTSFDIKIKRRPKEISPGVETNTSDSVVFRNQFSSPHRTRISFIKDFISPAPLVTGHKTALSTEPKKPLVSHPMRKKKAMNFFKHNYLNNMVKYPKVTK